MSEPLALTGAGFIGKRHLEAITASTRAHLVAIADPAPAAAELAAAHGVPHFTDTQAMLAATRPRGVIVATPTEQHLPPCEAALAAGAHVLVEKPVMATVEEAETLARLAAAAGREVLVGHHRRYAPEVEAAARLIRDGAIGRLVAVSGLWCVRKHDSYFDAGWRRAWEAGPILTNLIHEIDYLRHICGEVTAVQAESSNLVNGWEKEDVAALTLRFDSGALGSFILSDQADSPWSWEFATGENPAFPGTGQNALRFAGTEGALEFPVLRLWRSDGDAPSWLCPKTVKELPQDPADALLRQIDHFAEVIAGTAPPRISAADATRTLRVTAAVREAAARGSRITL